MNRALVVISCALIACRMAPEELTFSGLVVLPRAANVSRSRSADTSQHVRYTLRASFPAKEVVDTLSARLLQSSWVPRDTNAQAKWRELRYESPASAIRQLTLAWDRPSGAFVVYELSYPLNGGPLEVHGFVIPAMLSKQWEEALKGLS